MKKFGSCFLFLIIISVNGFAQTRWDKYEGNPVLTAGEPGAWDSTGVIATGTLFDGTTYQMWYSVLDSSQGIGYATSTDGLDWTKHPANPVLEPGSEGSWDIHTLGSPNVVIVDSTFHMWYSASNGIGFQIGHATSTDGFTWTKHDSNPVIELGPEGAWDDEWAFNQMVIFKDATYHMWYAGWGGIYPRIGYATSSDGVDWIKYAGNPVFDVGTEDNWDDAGVTYPSVVFNGTNFEMWYTGTDSLEEGTPFSAGPVAIGYATSPDAITWTRFDDNPVLSQGQCCEEWDWILVFLSNVIFDGVDYQMWYSGFGFDFDELKLNFSIGYATSLDSVITSISDVPDERAGLPDEYSLAQNYPNPFNPSTLIEFGLPASGRVSLVIYTLRGEEVARLIERNMSAGYHEVTWDASNMASGVYLYRLQSGDFVRTRKMVLLK